jgi:putative methyltransferase
VELLPDNLQEEVLIPRYVRVNTFKATVEEEIDALTVEGWVLAEKEGEKGTKVFCKDDLLPHLLRFPPSTDLHAHATLLAGKIVLQDKASCMPPYVLNPQAGWHVIDCCAAPGNKTGLAAQLIREADLKVDSTIAMDSEQAGHVNAFERDTKRFGLLNRMLAKQGADVLVSTDNSDFLNVDVKDAYYAGVKGAVVDPSCSGSGMIQRLDYHMSHTDMATDVEEQKRVSSLAGLQLSLVLKAMSFPAMERVVYSTCSVYDKENEAVVAAVLTAMKGQFELEVALPKWKRRGRAVAGLTTEQARKLVRVDPAQDRMNGFFVACFVRKVSKNAKKNAKKRRQKKRKRAALKLEAEERTAQAEKQAAAAAELEKATADTASAVPTAKKSKKKSKKKHKKHKSNNNASTI